MYDKYSSQKKLIVGVVTLFIFFGCIWYLAEDHSHQHNESEEERENVVKLSAEQIASENIALQQAAPHRLKKTCTVPGKIIVNENKHAHIVAKASGIVKEVSKNLGDSIQPAETLAVIESKEMAESKAAYMTAQRREQLSKTVLNREKELQLKKISAEQDYIQALSTSGEANLDLELAKQKLHAMGLDQSDFERLNHEQTDDLNLYLMKAPFAGVVIERNITMGELMEAEKEAFAIADLSTVWVEMGIYPKDLAHIKKHQEVEITSSIVPNQAKAKIIYMSPIIDEYTKTAKAIAELSNAENIWYPGTYVCACITTGEEEVAIAVPKEAIQTIEGEPCVFTVHPEGFEKRCIKTGRSDDEYIEILSGLEPGEQYAATQTFILKADHGKGDAGE